MTAVSYDDLVAVATVGVSRRPLQVTSLDGAAAGYAGVLAVDDPAVTVLDAAALLVAARRAGVLPVPGVRCPPPAARDSAPELPARAAGLLDQAQRGDPGVLADLLGAAGAAGYRAPAPLLPALLDAALRDRALRPAVAAVLGARGRWLAGHRADWQRVADLAGTGGSGAAGAAGDPGLWRTGGRGERRSYLLALRDQDSAAARALLASGWHSETGDDRADLLTVLARGLSAADEEFLELALGDRKQTVRMAAAGLLAQLPGSALRRRAVHRGTPLLRLAGRTLVASLPGGVDAAAARDGIGGVPPAPGIAAAEWRLTELIAGVPLAEWVTRFGLDAAQLVTLPVAGGLGVPVHAGWRLAAVRQASPDWAAALLVSGAQHTAALSRSARPRAAWPADDQLAAVLPADARAARAADLLARGAGTPAALAELAACPGPWPEPLADAVMAMLRTVVRSASGSRGAQSYWAGSRWAGDLAAAAARNLPVAGRTDYAAALALLAEASTCPEPWPVVLHRTAGTIALRRAFLEEIR